MLRQKIALFSILLRLVEGYTLQPWVFSRNAMSWREKSTKCLIELIKMKTWRIKYKYLNSWKNQILMKKYNMFNWIGAVVLFYHFQPSQTMTKQNFDLTQNFQHICHLFEIYNIGESQFIFIILKRKMIKRSWISPKFWIPYSLLLFQLQTDRLKMAWHKGTWWPLAVKVKLHLKLY